MTPIHQALSELGEFQLAELLRENVHESIISAVIANRHDLNDADPIARRSGACRSQGVPDSDDDQQAVQVGRLQQSEIGFAQSGDLELLAALLQRHMDGHEICQSGTV